MIKFGCKFKSISLICKRSRFQSQPHITGGDFDDSDVGVDNNDNDDDDDNDKEDDN